MNTEQLPQQFQHLGLRTFSPCMPLAPWVQCFWAIGQSDVAALRVSTEKLYPDAGSSLHVCLSASKVEVIVSLNSETQWQAFNPSEYVFGVRFNPGGLKRLLNLPVHEFLAQAYDLEEIEPQIYRELLARMDANAPGANALQTKLPLNAEYRALEQHVHTIENWLCEKLHALPATGTKMQKLSKADTLLRALYANDSLQSLQQNVPAHRKTLQRQAKEQLGYNPSDFFLMRKMKQARFLLASGTSIVDTAMQLDFTDQPHFQHVFKAFNLETPLAYQKRKMSQIYNT